MNRKTGVLLSYVMMIFEVLSTLLLTPYIIRTLGQAEYGVYKLSASIIAYLLLLDLGVGNAITRYVAKYRVTGEIENSKKFLGIATIYYLAIAVIAVIGGIILIYVFPKIFAKGLTADEIKLGQTLLSITTINVAVTLGTSAYNNVIIAYEQFAVSKGLPVIQIIIRMILTVIMLKLGWGSVGIVMVNLIMTILCRGFFVLYVLFKIKLVPVFKKCDYGFIKEIVIFSSLILLQMIATQLNSSVDQLLIGSLVSSSAVVLGIYGVGTQITQYYQSIGTAFTSVLMPGVVNMVEKGATAKALTDEMIRIGRLIFMVLGMILAGFLICGREFILLWAGKENMDAYIVAAILMTAYLFILTEAIGMQILWAKNQHKELAVLKIIIVLLNILLTVVLIKWNPLIGATIGTFISLIVGDVVALNIIFYKKLNMNLWYYYRNLFKGILPCLLISVLCGFAVHMFFSNGGWVQLFVEVFIMCLAYVVCMFVFGFNSYEKNLLHSMLNKIINRRNK